VREKQLQRKKVREIAEVEIKSERESHNNSDIESESELDDEIE
jgi:hypothetical protein